MVFNAVTTFALDFSITNFCVAGGKDKIMCYLRFEKPTDMDAVLSLMLTCSKTGEYVIVPLSTKLRQKNFLVNMYKLDPRPIENLNVEERLSIPFHYLLPNFLEKYVHNEVDLSDPFLLKYSSSYNFLVASIDARRQIEHGVHEKNDEQ